MLTTNQRKGILQDGSQCLLLNNTLTFFLPGVLRQKRSDILHAGEEF